MTLNKAFDHISYHLDYHVLGRIRGFTTFRALLLTWRNVVGDLLADDGLVLQNFVQILQLSLRSSGEVTGISGSGRWLPAGADVQLSRTEELFK